MNSVTTKRGDDGQTDLMFGRRISKISSRVEAYGSVDELTAQFGVVRQSGLPADVAELILEIQEKLIVLMGELATLELDLDRYREKGFQQISEADVERIEQLTHQFEENCEIRFRGWAIPGKEGNLASAQLDLARVTCRRCERRVLALKQETEISNVQVCLFLNRLSDLLWVLARYTALISA